jgi:hypothetical protein
LEYSAIPEISGGAEIAGSGSDGTVLGAAEAPRFCKCNRLFVQFTYLIFFDLCESTEEH